MREVRLQRMRERLTADRESTKEREARLQQMRTRQHERLSVDTNEEREDQLPVKALIHANSSIMTGRSLYILC